MDQYISDHIAATHGRMYARLAGRLPRYPIPAWPWRNQAPGTPSQSFRVLDLGCGWGRWAISAAQAGHSCVAVDRSLQTLRAARRATEELSDEGKLPGGMPLLVCADLDRLPFRSGVFELAIAYGVWQYLPNGGHRALREAWALLRPGGQLRIQLPHRGGPRARVFRGGATLGRPRESAVTYWTLPQMRQLAAAAVPDALASAPRLVAEGFFSTNAQWEDRDLLPIPYRCLVAASRLLCRLCRRFPPLLHLADACWLEISRPGAAPSPARQFPFIAPASAQPSSAP